MTPAELEKFYDEKIAPDLLRLGEMCREKGLSFVCGVEWELDQVGRTAFLSPSASGNLRKVNHILQFGDLSGMVAITVTQSSPAKSSENSL